MITFKPFWRFNYLNRWTFNRLMRKRRLFDVSYLRCIFFCSTNCRHCRSWKSCFTRFIWMIKNYYASKTGVFSKKKLIKIKDLGEPDRFGVSTIAKYILLYRFWSQLQFNSSSYCTSSFLNNWFRSILEYRDWISVVL